MSKSIIYPDDDDPNEEEWPTLVELASLSETEKRLEEMEDREEAAFLRTDVVAKAIVVGVPIIVIAVVLTVLCGVRAWRKAVKLEKMRERMRSLDAQRWSHHLWFMH